MLPPRNLRQISEFNPDTIHEHQDISGTDRHNARFDPSRVTPVTVACQPPQLQQEQTGTEGGAQWLRVLILLTRREEIVPAFTPPPLPSDDKRWKIVNGTMRKNGFARHALIETLHTVQSSFGFLDDDAIRFVARSLRVPLSQAYGVVTFYHHFSLKPPGKHTMTICTGRPATSREPISWWPLPKHGSRFRRGRPPKMAR
jgi:hypothetical protein